MMNYTGSHNKVIETQTGTVVYRNSNFKKVREMKRHLNMGGGFDGITPDFFNHRISLQS
jgi:hypothetical protein